MRIGQLRCGQPILMCLTVAVLSSANQRAVSGESIHAVIGANQEMEALTEHKYTHTLTLTPTLHNKHDLYGPFSDAVAHVPNPPNHTTRRSAKS
jgi:hypothetical protein